MYFALIIICVFEILHPIIFSEINRYIEYNPHEIKDNIIYFIPNFNYNLEIILESMNNYYLLGALSSIVFMLDLTILNAFVLSRLVRIVAIYLVQFPNPNKNSHKERVRTHDLIISGHTIHWNLIHVYIFNNCNYTVNLITITSLCLYYTYLIKRKHHYSIDIFLGIYVSLSSYFIIKLYVISFGDYIFDDQFIQSLHLHSTQILDMIRYD